MTTILAGDFNVGDINWEDAVVESGSSQRDLCQKVIDIAHDHELHQFQRDPTRLDRTVDLFFINKPGLAKATNTIPGVSDHDIIVADCDLKIQVSKKPPWQIFRRSKVNWEEIRSLTRSFRDKFLTEYCTKGVEENYKIFKDHIKNVIKSHVPYVWSKSRLNVPWITSQIRRMCRKKQRMFNRAKNHHRTKYWEDYKYFKRDVTRAMRKARWEYINGILQLGLEEGNSRPFWRYIKSQKQDNVGIPALSHKDKLVTNNTQKAEILNDQFKSVLRKITLTQSVVKTGP